MSNTTRKKYLLDVPQSVNIDQIIQYLLSLRHQPFKKNLDIAEADIKSLIFQVRKVFLAQDTLLELTAPIKVCGDIHGQYIDLLRLFEYGGYPSDTNYLFLGDYVDRGKQSLEVVILLFCFKLKYPDNFFLLRGNHESASINRLYGFYEECKMRYSEELWKLFTDCFNCLPLCAIISQKIFCTHGGLSPELHSIDQIRCLARPTDIPDQGLLCDLLWSDPDKNVTGWGDNDRGVSFTFGQNIVNRFLKHNDFDIMIRAHQVVVDGFEVLPPKKNCVTLFSAPKYCGEFDNYGAMMSIDEKLVCTFHILPLVDKVPPKKAAK